MLSCFSHVWLCATLWTARLLCPWDSPGKSTGAGCHALLQRIFLIQGLNPYLLHLPALAGGFFTTSATSWSINTKEYSILLYTEKGHVWTTMSYHCTNTRLTKWSPTISSIGWRHGKILLGILLDLFRIFLTPRSMPQAGPVLNWWDGKVRAWSDGWEDVFLGWRMGLLVHRCLVPSSLLPSSSVGETIHPFLDRSPQLLCWWGHHRQGAYDAAGYPAPLVPSRQVLALPGAVDGLPRKHSNPLYPS